MNTKKLTIALICALVFAAEVALAAGAPENVTGLTATPIDSTSIGLTWNAAKDAGGGLVKNYRIYYGTTSVFTAGSGEYEKQVDTPNNTTSYVLTSLTANTKYYFAATAVDSAGVESEEYSLEASASTLAAEGADTTSPTVTSVSAPDKKHVKVVFSEAVQLPATNPEAAFTIVEQIDPSKTLTVSKASMDTADTSNKTVALETPDQTVNVNYIVTVGVAIKDLAGNPIVSGSTDSGLFLGSSAEPPAATPPATTPPATTPAATPVDCVKDMTCFLTHMSDCSAAKVQESDATYEYTLEITGSEATNCTVKYTADKHPNILFSGTAMDCKVPKGTYTKVEDYHTALNVDTNCTGDLQSGYKTVALADTTPPENVTNLLLTFTKELEKFAIILNWTASLDTAKDLVDQILYMSLDRGTTYDTGKSLGATVTTTQVSALEGGKEYTFKVTTKDAAGNESTGAVKSIRLPQTGMGIGLVLLGSALAARRALRKRKENVL